MASRIANLHAQSDALTSVNTTKPVNLHREAEVSENCHDNPLENVESLGKQKELGQKN